MGYYYSQLYTFGSCKRVVYDQYDDRVGTSNRIKKVMGKGRQGHVKTVYHESRKRELKIRLMNEGRCDQRLKAIVEESTSHTQNSNGWFFFFSITHKTRLSLEYTPQQR